MQIDRRGEVTRFEPSYEGGSKRVVEHGGQESALDYSSRIQECIRRIKRNLDGSLLGVNGYKLPTKGDCSRRQGGSALNGIPKWTRSCHHRECGRRLRLMDTIPSSRSSGAAARSGVEDSVCASEVDRDAESASATPPVRERFSGAHRPRIVTRSDPRRLPTRRDHMWPEYSLGPVMLDTNIC